MPEQMTTQQGNTPQGDAGNTNQPKGETIPKERFNQVYGELKELQRQVQGLTQQYGVQSLDQIPQVILQRIGQQFLQMLQDSGAAPQVAQYFHQIGQPIPELDEVARQVSQQPTGMPTGMPVGEDENDPYLAQTRTLQARIQQLEAQLKKRLSVYDQFIQQSQQQYQANLGQQLFDVMAEAVHKIYPKLQGYALQAAVDYMANKYKQQIDGNPNLTLDQFLTEANFEEAAKEALDELAQGLAVQLPQQPVVPQGQQMPGQQFGVQQPTPPPPTVQGNGPNLPDEDTVLEAKKNEIFSEIVAHEAGGESAPAVSAPVGTAPMGTEGG